MQEREPVRLDPMAEAIAEAVAAGEAGEVPVGAVLVAEGRIVARGGNRIRRDRDPTAHAEIVAIRAACRSLGTERLPGHVLYVTLEPCAMCAGAISLARIRRLYFGAGDPKGGGVEHGPRILAASTCHHAPEIYGGLRAREAAELLRAFFARLRD